MSFLDATEVLDLFDDTLDSDNFIKIAGRIYRPSKILKRIDLIMYREELFRFVVDLQQNDEIDQDMVDEVMNLIK